MSLLSHAFPAFKTRTEPAILATLDAFHDVKTGLVE